MMTTAISIYCTLWQMVKFSYNLMLVHCQLLYFTVYSTLTDRQLASSHRKTLPSSSILHQGRARPSSPRPYPEFYIIVRCRYQTMYYAYYALAHLLQHLGLDRRNNIKYKFKFDASSLSITVYFTVYYTVSDSELASSYRKTLPSSIVFCIVVRCRYQPSTIRWLTCFSIWD